MAFRAQRPYQTQPFDYGRAVGQGQQNALRSYQMGEAVKDVQGKNILNALDKQGLQGKDAINALKSSGRGDLIPQYQQKMHESQKRKFEFAKMNEYKVSDQASWELFNDEGLAAGALTPEEHAKSKATPWTEGRKNLDRLMGRKKAETFGEMRPTPGAPGFVSQKNMATGEEKNVKRKTLPRNVPSPADTYLKERFKGEAVSMDEATKAANSSAEKLKALDRFKNKSDKAQQGSMQPLVTGMQNFFASFGVEFEGLQSVREMEQAVGQIQAQYMQELGARGLTDKDMEVLRQSLPKINTDRESRIAVANILQKSYASNIEEWTNRREQEEKAFPELRGKISSPKWGKWYGENRDRFIQTTPDAPAAPDFTNMSNEELMDRIRNGTAGGMKSMRVDERP